MALMKKLSGLCFVRFPCWSRCSKFEWNEKTMGFFRWKIPIPANSDLFLSILLKTSGRCYSIKGYFLYGVLPQWLLEKSMMWQVFSFRNKLLKKNLRIKETNGYMNSLKNDGPWKRWIRFCILVSFSFSSSILSNPQKNLGNLIPSLTCGFPKWFPTCRVSFPFDTQFNLSIVFLKMNSGKTRQHRCKVLPSVDMNLRVLAWPRNTIITSMLLGKVWGWWSKWATTSTIFLASTNLDTIEGDMVDFLLVKHDDLGYVFWFVFSWNVPWYPHHRSPPFGRISIAQANPSDDSPTIYLP